MFFHEKERKDKQTNKENDQLILSYIILQVKPMFVQTFEIPSPEKSLTQTSLCLTFE